MSNLPINNMVIQCQLTTNATGGTGSFTTIPNILSFAGPGPFMVEMYEASYIGQAVVSKSPTIRNMGQLKLTLGYDPLNTAHQGLFTLFTTALVPGTSTPITSWTVEFTDSTPTTYAFNGFVKTIEVPGGTNKDQLKLEVTIEITGDVTGLVE